MGKFNQTALKMAGLMGLVLVAQAGMDSAQASTMQPIPGQLIVKYKQDAFARANPPNGFTISSA